MCHSSDFDHLQAPKSAHTGRYVVYGTITSPIGVAADMAFTLTLNALDDADAQATVADLISEPIKIFGIMPVNAEETTDFEDDVATLFGDA